MDLVRSEHPDALLLDIMMPGISGLDLLETIRADRSLTHLPVLILTAADSAETCVRALELGATDFLGKPVDPVELLPRVRNAVLLKAHYDHLKYCATPGEEGAAKSGSTCSLAVGTDSLPGPGRRISRL